MWWLSENIGTFCCCRHGAFDGDAAPKHLWGCCGNWHLYLLVLKLALVSISDNISFSHVNIYSVMLLWFYKRVINQHNMENVCLKMQLTLCYSSALKYVNMCFINNAAPLFRNYWEQRLRYKWGWYVTPVLIVYVHTCMVSTSPWSLLAG